MKEITQTNRRTFIKQSALAGSALLFPIHGITNSIPSFTLSPEQNLRVYLFSKHLQFLDYTDMCEVTKEMGFDGLDLTVRPGGHVEPERVAEDLPKAAEAMKQFGLAPRMMTTKLTDPKDELTYKVLDTASKLGFTHYRTGWLKYPEDRSIAESLELYAATFKQLEALNERLGIIGGYQNHAGQYVGASIWDLHQLLQHTSSRHLGSQYDIRHATVESGMNWETDLKLIQPYINSIVIKDFKWGVVDGKWRPVNVPLGEGMVDFNRYFTLLKKYGINVPVSLHLEYDLGGAEHGNSEISIPREEIFGRMKKDLSFIKHAWEAVR